MQRSQRKRTTPSWLKEKPYVKLRFIQDGITSKVTESSKLKLEENGRPLTGSLENYAFRIGQSVWCYWKTSDQKNKEYFEGEIIDLWDDAIVGEENLLNSKLDGIVEDYREEENVLQSPEKQNKRIKRPAKRRLETLTNDNDEEARAAKRLANKEKAMEESARQEDNIVQSRELREMSDEATDMLFDLMKEIISRLDKIEKKVDENQQNLEKVVRKIEKRKDHSLPVQVFVGKSDSTDSSRPGSHCTVKNGDMNPTVSSTPKANTSKSSSKDHNSSCSFDDDVNMIGWSSSNSECTDEVDSQENNGDFVIIGDPKFNIKADRECFEKIVCHSSTPTALALNLLDHLVPKEVQRISNIKGVFGKAPLDPMVLAAIKGQLKRQYKWTDEETDKHWSGKSGIQQKIADKCRNLNKSFGKK